MGKGLDTGKQFLQGVLSKISDPGQRAAAEQLLGSETFVTEIGNGVEGQSEIDRQLQALRQQTEDLTARQQDIDQREQGLNDWHGKLTDWHQKNRDTIVEAARSKAAGGTSLVQAGLTHDQLNEQLATERSAFLGYQRDQNVITRGHYAKFNEIVDLEPLLQHPQIGKVGLLGVYELVHKERLTKHQTDAEQKREDSIRADERNKVLAGQASMPYPSPTGVGSGSPLDALTQSKSPVVDEAVAHYTRLQQEQVGATR